MLGCSKTGAAVLVDPGGDVDELMEVVADHALEISQIWLTHAHVDHLAGVAEAVHRTGASVSLHADDRFLYDAAAGQGQAFGMVFAQPPPPQHWLVAGEVLRLGELRAEVLHVPGHSPGHVAFWLPEEGVVLSGDCVFAGSIGRTDLPGGSMHTLMSSIEKQLFSLGDAVQIYPGHGAPTTVDTEKRTNPFFTASRTDEML